MVSASDHVTVDGKPLPETPRRRLWRYHKPPGLVTTHSDPQGRPTVFERLPEELGRVISVGRLDLSSEGLLLLTNDGGLARHLELPATGWTRRYRVRAHGSVEEAALDRLRQGLILDGIRYGPIDARLERQQGSNVWLAMALQEGKNREVRKVLEALGLRVNRLIRIAYGPFQLGNLGRGEVAEVSSKVLREQLGKELARVRIIAGKHRGRAIRVPRTEGLRPTADRVREALFNILEHGLDWAGLDGARVIDAFAGTGAFGLEALSRGAARATFLDVDGAALLAIRRNAAAMGEARNVTLLKLDATRLPPPPGAASAPCDLAFLDPPYESGLALPALQGLASRHWLGPGAVAVVEVAAREPLAAAPRLHPARRAKLRRGAPGVPTPWRELDRLQRLKLTLRKAPQLPFLRLCVASATPPAQLC